MSEPGNLGPTDWCPNATHTNQEDDGPNVSPEMVSAIERQQYIFRKHPLSACRDMDVLWLNAAYTSLEMFGLATAGWAFHIDCYEGPFDQGSISVPCITAINVNKVRNLGERLFFRGNELNLALTATGVNEVGSQEMAKRYINRIAGNLMSYNTLQDYLSFDPLAAPPSDIQRKAAGFKKRITMHREFNTALSASGIFDPPEACMPTAYVNPGMEIGDCISVDVHIEALQRLVVRLEHIEDQTREHFRANDLAKVLNSMETRATLSEEMYLFGRRLLGLCAREEAARKGKLDLMRLLNTDESFADALLPYIEPVAGASLMQTCKELRKIGKAHKRSYWLELVGCNMEASFPAHSDTALQDKDCPVINRDKMVRLVPRLCFEFLTAQDNGPPVNQKHVFKTLALHRNLQTTHCSLHLETIFGDEVPAGLGGVFLFSSALSPMLGINWTARRFPKLRLFVSAKSADYVGEAMAFQIKIYVRDDSQCVTLCGKSEPFYVTGKAMTRVGIEGARRRDKRHRQNIQMANQALQNSLAAGN